MGAGAGATRHYATPQSTRRLRRARTYHAMPMSSMDLIERVRDHPEIWLCSHPFHMNRVVLRRFWLGLAEEYDDDEATLRKRWKHYKDQFRKEYKKQREKAIPDQNVAWQFFKPLSFLKADIEQKEKDADENESDSSEEVPIKAKVKIEKIREGRVVKKVPNPKIDIILKKVKETKAIVEERLTDLQAVNRNDPDFLYLLSLFPTIKQLTEIQKLQLKGKINEWLLQQITINTYGGSAETYLTCDIKTEGSED